MAKKVFSFEGHVSKKTYAPRIDSDAWLSLEVGSILMGVVDHILVRDNPTAEIMINGHRLELTLWGKSIEEARTMIKRQVHVAFDGMNDSGYPRLLLLEGYIDE